MASRTRCPTERTEVARNGQGGHPAGDPNVDRLLKQGAGLKLQQQPVQVRTHRQVTFQACNTILQPIVSSDMTVVGYQLVIQDPADNTEYVLPFNGEVLRVWRGIIEEMPEQGAKVGQDKAQMTVEDALQDPKDPNADRFLITNRDPGDENDGPENDPDEPMPALPSEAAYPGPDPLDPAEINREIERLHAEDPGQEFRDAVDP